MSFYSYYIYKIQILFNFNRFNLNFLQLSQVLLISFHLFLYFISYLLIFYLYFTLELYLLQHSYQSYNFSICEFYIYHITNLIVLFPHIANSLLLKCLSISISFCTFSISHHKTFGFIILYRLLCTLFICFFTFPTPFINSYSALMEQDEDSQSLSCSKNNRLVTNCNKHLKSQRHFQFQ